MPGHGLVHLLDLPDEKLEIIEVEVTEGAPAAGLRVSEIDLPDGSLIISVLPRGKAGFVPKADTVIEPGDEVLVVLDPGLEPHITAQFAPNGRARLTPNARASDSDKRLSELQANARRCVPFRHMSAVERCRYAEDRPKLRPTFSDESRALATEWRKLTRAATSSRC